jgi:single-stranded DNA-specific DHH superfamily exonuclease
MLKSVEKISREFLEISKEKSIRIIGNQNTDGICAVAILIKTLQKLDKKFSTKTVKSLSREIVEKEFKRDTNEIFIFCGLDPKDFFNKKKSHKIFIFFHQKTINLPSEIHTLNPLNNENKIENHCTSSGIVYMFSKEISKELQYLSDIAIIGMIGTEYNPTKSIINKIIIEDSFNLTIKKGITLYPATRPIKRTLEYSTSPYISGITGNGKGVLQFLEELQISQDKNILDLTEEEISRLSTAIKTRQAKHSQNEEIYGDIFVLNFFNTKEDVRELSVLINSCSHLGKSDVAIEYCIGNSKSKKEALEIYTRYNHELVSALKIAEKIEKIDGKGFTILNAKNQIKEGVIGTVCSVISSSPLYKEGTIFVGMAQNTTNQTKVTARISGRIGRNVKEMFEKTIQNFKENYPETKADVGGNKYAAGCFIESEYEKVFIENLQKVLEIEEIKIQ